MSMTRETKKYPFLRHDEGTELNSVPFPNPRHSRASGNPVK